MKKLHLLMMMFCLMAVQCDHFPTFALGEPFTLKIGEKKVDSQNKDLLVHFNKVKQDSRCPKGVNCVWEGEVVAELVLGKLGKDTLELTFRPGREKAAVGRAMGHHFRFQEVKPYPEKGVALKAEDYIITLEVKAE
ncbi:MAG: hypothetical protein R2828_11430 [Saprospiraceae bacterium]